MQGPKKRRKRSVSLEEYESLRQELNQIGQRLTLLEQGAVESIQLARQKTLFSVIAKIHESLDLDIIFRATVTEVRQLLNADRVAIFRFDPASNYKSGEMVAEEVLPGFRSALAEKVDDHCFGHNHAIHYQRGRIWSTSNIYETNLAECHIAILARFQVVANLVVPLLEGGKLWGLLCIHQCSGPRQWQGAETEFVTQIAMHLGIALQQSELLSKAEQRSTILQTTLEAQLRQRAEELALEAERERAIAKMIERIRQTLDIDTIFEATTEEVRNILSCDRVVVYQFAPDWSGEFVSESFAEGWEGFVGNCDTWSDTFLQETQGSRYRYHETFAVDDIHQIPHSICYLEKLQQLHIRAYTIVPVFVGETLWGLLAAYQNDRPRHWEPGEIGLLAQIGNQLGVALRQAESLKQVRIQSEQFARAVEREQAVATIIDKIRRSLDIDTIFQTTAQEVQSLLKVDRVGIYRFNADWSGEFVVESIAEGQSLLLEGSQSQLTLCQEIDECGAQLLSGRQVRDTYVQAAGESFISGEISRTCSDIYSAGFSDCYIKALEQYQARAYAIVSIYQGQQLWGLLAAYQNTGPRHWEESDTNFLTQIAAQLGVALQQVELLGQAEQRSTVLQSRLEDQLRQRAAELAEEAERERAIAQVIEKIRQTLDIETIFQTTATEVRQLLNADRVAMFQFDLDSGYNTGVIVAEAVLPGYSAAMLEKVDDHCFGQNHANYYQQGRVCSVADIYAANLQPCYLATLSRFQVQANLVAPLLKGEKLWGLLCIHQCSAPREWQDKEIEFVTHIAVQLGVALQQAELLAHAQRQSAELKFAKEAADAANQAKSEFLAKISHELRTPLNAILGFTQLLVRNPSLNSEQREYLDIISSSGEHLLTLINDVLEMSKIEAGQVTLNESHFDLFGLLDSLEEMLQLKARSKGLKLRFDLTADVPQYIYTDESKLRQVLINLLGNAIKFTQVGSVTLSVTRKYAAARDQNDPRACTLSFKVRDTGSGIVESELEQLFEAFVQAESGRKSQEGTGLGLPISRQFIRLLGGDITVRSKVGQGSTFQFKIRVQEGSGSTLVPSQQHKQSVISLAENQPDYRILVVEDKWENRQLLVKLLSGVGFAVQEAVNGAEAVALWESWQPHLIWMDMQMPVMDGYTATRQIRQREQMRESTPTGPHDDRSKPKEGEFKTLTATSETPQSTTPALPHTIIIALTAHAFEEDRETVMIAGCDDFITKPFREEVLFAKMAQYLDIEYLYEEGQSDEAELFSSLFQLDVYRETLATLPAAWVTQLYQAAVQLDDMRLLELAAELPETHASLAVALKTWVEDLRLDIVLELIQPGYTQSISGIAESMPPVSYPS